MNENLSKANSEEFISGFTWRSMLAVVGAALIFIPASTYTSLVLGGTLGGMAVFFVALLVAEISRLLNVKLSKQEMLIIYYGAGLGGVTGLGTFFGNLVYRAYFVQSPIAWSFKINGKPLPLLVPNWLAPPLGSNAYIYRTLFYPDFFPAIVTWLIVASLGTIADISLAMFFSSLYNEVEQLRFPYADLDVAMVDILHGGLPETTRIFFVTFIFGLIWGVIAYLPSMIGMPIIPIPYIDLTWAIQNILPGVPFAIPTVISSYFGPMLVPLNIAVYVFLVSVFMTLLQSLFTTTFTNVFPEWVKEYEKGMGYATIVWRAGVRVWLVPQIGFGLAAALFLLYKSRRTLLAVLKRMLSSSLRSESKLGFPPLYISILLYLASTSVSVAFFHYLVPSVPVWLPIFVSIGYSFLQGLFLTVMQGEAGFTVSPPWLWQALVSSTSYTGYTGFVFPPVIAGGMAPGFSQQVNVALRVKTKPTDLIKLAVVGFFLSNIIGLISLNFFWMVAPIPSAIYPATVYGFPSTAMTDSLIVTRQLRINVGYILSFGGIALIIASVLELLSKFGLPFSPVGFFMGLFNWSIMGPFQLLVGSAISNVIIPKFIMKRKDWESMRGVVVAGVGIGEGTIIMISLALSFITRSAYPWPW